MTIPETELRITTYSPPLPDGCQRVKVEHLPSGTAATCTTERSMFRARRRAIREVEKQLAAHE